MEEKIIHNIEGKEYLLVEIPMREGKSKNYDMLMKKYKCIFQGIKEVKQGGFFSYGYVIVKVLVPTVNIFEFQNECN